MLKESVAPPVSKSRHIDVISFWKAWICGCFIAVLLVSESKSVRESPDKCSGGLRG